MPRKKIMVTSSPKKRKAWAIEDMKRAVIAVREKSMGTLKAAKTFGVPRTTVQRLAKMEYLSIDQTVQIKLGRGTVLDPELEQTLVRYILEMEAKFYGLTRKDIKRMAFQLAEGNGRNHPFGNTQAAGRGWLDLFMQRHRNTLSIRKPTGTSFARARGLNKESVNNFFTLLQEVYEKHNFPANRVFNVDETGLTVVQNKIVEVVGRKGKRQIASLTFMERGSLITLIACMSAGGDFVPPMLIFPRKNMNIQLMKGTPPGSIAAVHPSGWVQTTLFTQWFRHFIDTVKPSVTSPVLLVLDGHYSHTRNLDVVNIARENNVSIISLPPHSTHKLQPLDKTFMGALKTYYSEEIRQWIRHNHRALSQYDIGELFGKAYLKTQTAVSNICSFANRKEHYKAQHDFITNLFDRSTRPKTVQDLYEAAAKTPIPLMRQMDRLRRDGHRSSQFFACTPVLGARRKKIRAKVDIDIETSVPIAVGELRRWTSAEAIGDVTVAPDCPNRIAPNTTFTDGNVTDGTVVSDDEAIDHKLPSPEEQLQIIALRFPADIVAVDITGRAFNRMSSQRRTLLHSGANQTADATTLRRQVRTRKPRNRRRNTIAGTDQKELQDALIDRQEPSTSVIATCELESPIGGAVFRSKSSEPLRSLKKDSPDKKSHFHTLKQWGKNRLKMINKSDTSKSPEKQQEDPSEFHTYETVSLKRKRGFNRDKRLTHERNPSYSSSEKSSINLPITTPFSAAMNIAVKLRESSAQRRLRRAGGNKDEPHSSSGNWSASSESGRASIGSEITSTTQPKSTTSAATSSNSLNMHLPSSVNSRRKFVINTSGSSSITSEGTVTPDIHDFHEDGETSSVYSCDTEGYYTSFHMDSGLKTLKEEETPVTPLHSTSAFSNSSSSNTVLTAENEYELFGKGSTSTTASSAGTVCTTLKATGSSRSLSLGPTVPERKSSLSKTNKDKSPGSSLEREFGSEKTGTVKRSPASSKSIVVAVVHKQTNGDVSPDSGHNTSSSPIESANSPNGIRSGSEFEFSECSDMEGPDRIERIRVKTTINSSRIPSMCVITPPHSDDESVNSHYENVNNKSRRKFHLPLKPLETDLDNLEFADSESEDVAKIIVTNSNGITKMQVINVNPKSGYATLANIDTNKRAPSPSGGTVTVKQEIKSQTSPIFKATLLPFNNVFGKIKSTFAKKDIRLQHVKGETAIDDSGDYVTIADVTNNNEKVPFKPIVDTEYVSLNDLPPNSTADSLERKKRQGARVTLDAEGKVVYTSDSLKRRKGAHTTFEPGPYIKESTAPVESPVPIHRVPKNVRPVQGTTIKNNLRPLSPQMEKLVIRPTSGAELVRVPPSTIVSPTIIPNSPKPNNTRGAYVHMQETRAAFTSSNEKEPVYSPSESPPCHNWVKENPTTPNTFRYQQSILEGNMYKTLPSRKTPFLIENYNLERPITPDIMRGLPSKQYKNNSQNYNISEQLEKSRSTIPQVTNVPYQSNLYSSTPTETKSLQRRTNISSSETNLNESLKISPIDPRHIGGFQSSTPSAKDLKSAINLESKLLSPKKTTMSTEELYAVIHKGKKKLNVQTDSLKNESPAPSSPSRCKTPDRIKSPETGYIGNKTRSRYSWSPSDGEYVDYNTNIDPSPEAPAQSSHCNDRKKSQTSRLDFKKLLLQHNIKLNSSSPSTKKLSAVEQLKLSKQTVPIQQSPSLDINILELSGSPRNLQNRRFNSGAPSSPEKRPMPKLMSPRSQWRFTNPRSDVLSTTIPEDCGEEDSPNGSVRIKNASPFNSKSSVFKNSDTALRTSNVSQHLKNQRAQFFNSPQTSPTFIKTNSNQGNSCIIVPTLETAF